MEKLQNLTRADLNNFFINQNIQIDIPNFITMKSQIVFAFSLIIIPSFLRYFVISIMPIKAIKESIILIGLGEMGKSFINTQGSRNKSRFIINGIFDDNVDINTKYSDYYVVGKLNVICSVAIAILGGYCDCE